MPSTLRALSSWLRALTLLAACSTPSGTTDAGCSADDGCQPNVRRIIVDDLGPELGAYGRSHAVSPNIDRLAAESLSNELRSVTGTPSD